jgi:hypothetical protein
MPDSKPQPAPLARDTISNTKPYELDYFARKHDISREQARDLIGRIGNDRGKLNAAASKIFRK